MGAIENFVEVLDPRLGHVNVSSPKVSIVVTNFNYGSFIKDCLQSVSCQTYPELECVVVDDNSSDDSVDKIHRFIDNDRSHIPFKLIRHTSTQGQYAAFRTGMAHANGVFVSFLDADDLLLPDFVREHVRMHLHCAPVAFTSSNQYQIDSEGELIGGHHPDLHTLTAYRGVGTVSLRRGFWVWATTSSMMFRRSVLDFVFFDGGDAFKKCADNYVCHFADLLGGSILIPTVLGCYRRHRRNSFSKNPLIGGRLPTGDMRDHPTHNLVLHHIRSCLFERHQQFIALLGLDGFLQILAKVTRLTQLWSTLGSIRRTATMGRPRFCVIYARLNLRTFVRALRGRRPGYTLHDLEGVKRGKNVASYTDYQRHRRNTK